MGALARFWRSTVGKKIVMAVTGIVLIAFIVGHLLGNLLVFRGAAEMNHYAAFLRSTGSALWLVRGVLLLSVILHVTAAVQLTRIDRAARPIAYQRRVPQVSTWAARTIRWGGVLILVFVIYHLLHFTFGTVHPDFRPGDVYRNIIVGFSVWWVAAFYLVSMIALGLHLYHGTWSSIRTLGLSRPTYHPLKRRIALVLAVVVWLGFSAIPLAVLLGIIK